MQPFDTLRAVAAPMPQSDINTDAIIPSVWLRAASQNLAEGLFGAWRRDAQGKPRTDFVLNEPRFRDAKILVAGANFGCGSSREAAVWALLDSGIRCVIAPSFGDIFAENSYKNGLLPLILDAMAASALCDALAAAETPIVAVDLKSCTVTSCDGRTIAFQIPPRRRDALLSGADEMTALLARRPEIDRFQAADRERRPWVYTRGA